MVGGGGTSGASVHSSFLASLPPRARARTRARTGPAFRTSEGQTRAGPRRGPVCGRADGQRASRRRIALPRASSALPRASSAGGGGSTRIRDASGPTQAPRHQALPPRTAALVGAPWRRTRQAADPEHCYRKLWTQSAAAAPRARMAYGARRVTVGAALVGAPWRRRRRKLEDLSGGASRDTLSGEVSRDTLSGEASRDTAGNLQMTQPLPSLHAMYGRRDSRHSSSGIALFGLYSTPYTEEGTVVTLPFPRSIRNRATSQRAAEWADSQVRNRTAGCTAGTAELLGPVY